MKVGLSGRYRLSIYRVDSDGNPVPGTRRGLPWFHNHITDAGLEALGSNTGTDKLDFCQLGEGSRTPADSDTALEFPVGTRVPENAAAGSASGQNVSGGFLWRKVGFRFAAGTINGRNLTEVVVGPPTGGVFSRALLTDAAGNPTTITLGPDEVLDVVYELRVYLTLTDIVTVHDINGVSTTVTTRVHGWDANQNNYWTDAAASVGGSFLPRMSVGNNISGIHSFGTQPAANVLPASQNSNEGGTMLPYVPGSRETVLRYAPGLNDANFAGGIGVVWGAGGGMGFVSHGFSPKVNKTADYIGEFEFGVSWARRAP